MRGVIWRGWLALGLAFMVIGAGPAEPVVAYKGAAILDVKTGTVRRNLALIVRGERIEALVPAKALAKRLPPGAKVIDVDGLFALPGLIDTHQHLATVPDRRGAEAYLRREVYSGVTAVRDMAGDARALADLSRVARVGEIPAPDIYYSALMAGPSFFDDPRVQASTMGVKAGAVPWSFAVTPETDLRLAVAAARGTGATGIKLYANLPADLVRAITAEAHRQGLLVWAHAAVFPASPKDVVDAGADVMSHVCMLAYQASDAMPRAYHRRAPVDETKFAGGRLDPAVAALFVQMKARGIVLDATNWVYAEIERLRAKFQNGQPPSYCSAALAERLTGEAYRAGVEIAAGTDAPAPIAYAYPAVFEELDLFERKAGMAPLDVLRAATVIAAKAIGQQDEMGTIAPGKLANIMFVARNPLKSTADLRSVVLTVKRGARYWRRDYRPITSDEVPDEN